MRHFLIFFVTFLLTSLSYNDKSEALVPADRSKQDIKEMAKRPLVLQKASFSFAPLLKSCHSSHYNVFDTVTKCLLPPFKSVEQSKLRHACLSKKKTFVEQTNHSPNDYEKVASDSIVKAPLQTVHEPESIWNSNADNKQDSLSTRDFLTNTEKEKIKELASQVPDSIRNRFASLVDKWNIAIDHNPKTRYSASTYSYTELPEFIPLKSMGKQIVPLILERMINPCDFYFLVLYEAVLEGNETNDDSKFSESGQIRAIGCVEKWLEKQ